MAERRSLCFPRARGKFNTSGPYLNLFCLRSLQDQTDQTHHGSFKPSSYRTEKPGLLYIQEEQWTLPIVFLRGGDDRWWANDNNHRRSNKASILTGTRCEEGNLSTNKTGWDHFSSKLNSNQFPSLGSQAGLGMKIVTHNIINHFR